MLDYVDCLQTSPSDSLLVRSLCLFSDQIFDGDITSSHKGADELDASAFVGLSSQNNTLLNILVHSHCGVEGTDLPIMDMSEFVSWPVHRFLLNRRLNMLSDLIRRINSGRIKRLMIVLGCLRWRMDAFRTLWLLRIPDLQDCILGEELLLDRILRSDGIRRLSAFCVGAVVS